MTQTEIPFLFYRSGAAKVSFINRKDLPRDEADLEKVLMSIIGAGDQNHINGMGGGTPDTAKIGVLSKADDGWADVDFLFAQLEPSRNEISFRGSFGNCLAGVGPAAIEMGLVPPRGGATDVKIRMARSSGTAVSSVRTPGGKVSYDGGVSIGEVSGEAAPVDVSVFDFVGSQTGKLFPTKNRIDVFKDVEITCIDAFVPTVIANASSFGLSDLSGLAEFNAKKSLVKKVEAMRKEAATLMGIDALSSLPVTALLAGAQNGGTIAVGQFEYGLFSETVSPSLCQTVAASALVQGTLASQMLEQPDFSPVTIAIETVSGSTDVILDFETRDGRTDFLSCRYVSTARKLASGQVFVPKAIWDW